jgi:hypothetical protein
VSSLFHSELSGGLLPAVDGIDSTAQIVAVNRHGIHPKAHAKKHFHVPRSRIIDLALALSRHIRWTLILFWHGQPFVPLSFHYARFSITPEASSFVYFTVESFRW